MHDFHAVICREVEDQVLADRQTAKLASESRARATQLWELSEGIEFLVEAIYEAVCMTRAVERDVSPNLVDVGRLYSLV